MYISVFVMSPAHDTRRGHGCQHVIGIRTAQYTDTTPREKSFNWNEVSRCPTRLPIRTQPEKLLKLGWHIERCVLLSKTFPLNLFAFENRVNKHFCFPYN